MPSIEATPLPTTGTDPAPVGEELVVNVSSIVRHTFTIDPNHLDWRWLRDHPRDTWRQLLESSAETGGQVEQELEVAEFDGAYREVEIIGPRTFSAVPARTVEPDRGRRGDRPGR